MQVSIGYLYTTLMTAKGLGAEGLGVDGPTCEREALGIRMGTESVGSRVSGHFNPETMARRVRRFEQSVWRQQAKNAREVESEFAARREMYRKVESAFSGELVVSSLATAQAILACVGWKCQIPAQLTRSRARSPTSTLARRAIARRAPRASLATPGASRQGHREGSVACGRWRARSAGRVAPRLASAAEVWAAHHGGASLPRRGGL